MFFPSSLSCLPLHLLSLLHRQLKLTYCNLNLLTLLTTAENDIRDPNSAASRRVLIYQLTYTGSHEEPTERVSVFINSNLEPDLFLLLLKVQGYVQLPLGYLKWVLDMPVPCISGNSGSQPDLLLVFSCYTLHNLGPAAYFICLLFSSGNREPPLEPGP